jgi:hypothetical protein
MPRMQPYSMKIEMHTPLMIRENLAFKYRTVPVPRKEKQSANKSGSIVLICVLGDPAAADGKFACLGKRR